MRLICVLVKTSPEACALPFEALMSAENSMAPGRMFVKILAVECCGFPSTCATWESGPPGSGSATTLGGLWKLGGTAASALRNRETGTIDACAHPSRAASRTRSEVTSAARNHMIRLPLRSAGATPRAGADC